MSSEKTRGKRVRRKSKVSWGRLIRPGLVGPKLRPKGVGEGQSVKYSDTTCFTLSVDLGTQEARFSALLDVCV